MLLTAFGLGLDLIGALAIGFVAPRRSQLVALDSPGQAVRPVGIGAWADRLGWPLIVLGFLLQLRGTLSQVDITGS